MRQNKPLMFVGRGVNLDVVVAVVAFLSAAISAAKSRPSFEQEVVEEVVVVVEVSSLVWFSGGLRSSSCSAAS